MSWHSEFNTVKKQYFKEDKFSHLSSHDSNFCSWPGIVGISTEMLGTHHTISSSIGLKKLKYDNGRYMSNIVRQHIMS